MKDDRGCNWLLEIYQKIKHKGSKIFQLSSRHKLAMDTFILDTKRLFLIN